MYSLKHELGGLYLCTCIVTGFTAKPIFEIFSLIGDASAARTTEEEEIDARVAQFLEMENPDIVIDLREVNCSGSDKYKVFWEQCKVYLHEITAVYKR